MKTIENAAMLSALQGAGSILLCTHISPDGDAIGSMLATGMMLTSLGKTVTMTDADGVPEEFRSLPWADRVQTSVPETAAFDLAFALDAGDEGRLGSMKDAFLRAPVTAQLDHHGTNPWYAQHNEVDFEASSTGAIVMRLARALRVPITRDMAICLYAAIARDTGNFSFRNADEEAFSCAAELMRAGLPLQDMARDLFLMRSRENTLLIGRAISSMRFLADGKATVMRLSRADFALCDAKNEDAGGIVNFGLYMPGVQIACLAEQDDDGVRFSLRAKEPQNVARIAVQFGGGGHELAAGCRVKAEDFNEAVAAMESAIFAAL